MLTNFKNSRPQQFTFLFFVFLLLYFFVPENENSLLWRLPPLLKDIPLLINSLLDNLMFKWLTVPVYDPDWQMYEDKPVFRLITRAIADFLLFLIIFIREIFLGGLQTIGSITGGAFKEFKWLYLPAVPWTAVVVGLFILGYRLQGLGLAFIASIGFFYVSIFGQWEPTMETLSLVLVTAPICFVLGLSFGILGYLSKKVEKILQPILNIAQTMPHFSYLVPILVLFGIGDHAGAVATIIFATPPMIRLTILGLKKISPEVVESGLMSGCNRFQLLFRVLIPTARRDILIGVNQVIMQCLAMTTIAAFIGAKGLGFNLKVALNGLKIGKAAEIGICVVIIAVVLDKLSLAWANKQKDYFANLNFYKKNLASIYFILLTTILGVVAYFSAFYFENGFNYLYLIPFGEGLTIAPILDAGVDWIWETFFYYLNIFNKFLITNVLFVMRDAYLGMPVISTFVLVMGAGYIIGGIRSCIIVGALILFIALSEYWNRALITAYMATFAVGVSAILGIVTGSICARNEISAKFILGVCDFFQTFPSFIYLIPVILLFGITDTSVMIAAIAYASVPATRYTVEGLRSVPSSLHDAASMSGVSNFQRWKSIELPLAFPHIMLGINQTLIFALMMIVLGALIGTEDLGQIIMGCLSRPNGAGIGLTLGIFVSFICLAADNLIRTWADERKKMLGID